MRSTAITTSLAIISLVSLFAPREMNAVAPMNYTLRVTYIGTSPDGVFQKTASDVLSMAWLEISERTTPLARTLVNNLTIDYVELRTTTSRQSALFAAMSAREQHNASVVIGSDWSAESIVMNLYLSAFNVPQISATSTSVLLSDKTNYPTFMRTCVADNEQGEALAELVNEFHWDTVALLTSDDEYASSLGQDFALAAQKLNITVVATQQFARFAVDISAQIGAIRSSGARIILLSCLEADVLNVFTTASRMGVTGPGYTWLGTDGWSTGNTVALGQSNPTIAAALTGAIAFTPFSGEGTREYEAFLDRKAADKARRPGTHTDYASLSRKLAYSQEPYVYEAAYAVALGADALLREGKLPHLDGLGLLAQMKRTAFTGPTGGVRFTPMEGNRVGMYGVVNFNSSNMVSVGKYSADTGIMWTRSIVWSDGQSSTIPSDAVCVPTCVNGLCVKVSKGVSKCACTSAAWTGVRCSELVQDSVVAPKSSSKIVLIVAPVVVAVVALAAAALLLFAWRRKKRQIDLQEKQHRKVIDFRELDVVDLIGTGSFGDVYKARWRGTDVAVKRILPSKLRPDDSMIGVGVRASEEEGANNKNNNNNNKDDNHENDGKKRGAELKAHASDSNFMRNHVR
eukprot:Opistho-2@1502